MAYYFKSKFLVSRTRTCHYPVGHTSNLTVTSCTDGTTEHTEDEGLDINICCSSNKSFNSPVVPLFRRANWLASSVLTLKTASNKTKRKMAHQSAIPWVMMFPASEEVFASITELCSGDFFIFPLLWHNRTAVTFSVLCSCWDCYAFLWYLPLFTKILVCDWS